MTVFHFENHLDPEKKNHNNEEEAKSIYHLNTILGDKMAYSNYRLVYVTVSIKTLMKVV